MTSDATGTMSGNRSDDPAPRAGDEPPELVALARDELAGVLELSGPLQDRGFWMRALARDPCCGSRAFVSLRRRGEGLDEEGTRAVLRSLKAGRGSRSPTVLPVRRFGCTDHLLWFTEPATAGQLLDDVLGEGASPAARVLNLLGPVVEALTVIHENGMAHGALTPSVIHRDEDGRIRVRNLWCDRHLLRAALDSGAEADAAAYAAPEFLKEREPGPEGDQHAFAAIVVRALSGSPPRLEGSPLPAEVPDPWRAILLRGLHPRASERYASVPALWKALVEATPASEVDGRPGAMGGPSPSPAREAALRGESRAPRSGPPSDRERPPFRGGYDWEPREHSTASNPSGRWSRIVGILAVLGLFAGATEFVPDRIFRSNTEPRAEEAEGRDTDSPDTDIPDTEAPSAGTEGEVAEVPPPGPLGDGSTPTLEDVSSDPQVPSGGSDGSPVSPGEGSSTGVEPTEDQGTVDRPATGQTPVASPNRNSDPSSSGAVARASRDPGSLYLGTYPWGRAYLDGDYVGNTPVVGLRISPGTHTIRVEREGFEPYVQEVVVDPGEVLRLSTVTLQEENS